MATSYIKCPTTGKLVPVKVTVPELAIESLVASERKTRTLEKCPECGKNHDWTATDIISGSGDD